MEKCSYYNECGSPQKYECKHLGYLQNGRTAECFNEKVRIRLEQIASTTDVEIDELHESARVTNKLLQIHIGGECC